MNWSCEIDIPHSIGTSVGTRFFNNDGNSGYGAWTLKKLAATEGLSLLTMNFSTHKNVFCILKLFCNVSKNYKCPYCLCQLETCIRLSELETFHKIF